MNRAILNLVLLFIVVALALTAYLTREQAETEPPLTTLTGETISRLELNHPGKPAIVLVKDKDEWRLQEPVRGRADPYEVASLVAIAAQSVHRALPMAEVDAAELRLAPPRFSLRINDQLLNYGGVEPLSSQRYVQRGDEVVLVDDPPEAVVDADASDLLAKELIDPGATVLGIEVPGLRVTRADAQSAWQATPAGESATDAALKAFVEAWQSARAMWNQAMPDDGGQGAPITITTSAGVITLNLVAREPQLLLDRPELKLRYAVSKADTARLFELGKPQPEPGGAGS